MKQKLYILLFSLFAGVLSVQAASMAQADSAYIAGNYQQAAQQYQTLIDNGMQGVDLYYNAGNAYFRMGKIADAIIQYERALRLDATHADAKHNLAFAQAMTVDKIDPVGTIFLVNWWKTCYRLASADTWAYASVGLFLLCLVCITVFVFGKSIAWRKTGFSIAIVALLFTIITALCASSRNAEVTDTSVAIIYVPTVTTKSSPDDSGNDLFILHEGTKVVIKSSLGEWTEVMTEDGNTGWLPTQSIVVI